MNETPATGDVPATPAVAGEGEILVDDGGNVIVGVPTAVAVVVNPTDGDPED